MKKQLIIFTLFCILLAGIVLAVPALENIYGVKNFVDGLQSNGSPVATLDANSKVPLANSYTPDLSGYVPYDANSHVADSAVYDKHTNLDANSLTLAHASIDPNGVIISSIKTNLICQQNIADRGLSVYQNNSGIHSPIINFYKSYGTYASPSIISSGSYAGLFNFKSYGSSYLTTSSFGARVNGTVSADSVPTDLFFATSGGADDIDPYANNHIRLLIKSDGKIGLSTTVPTNDLSFGGNNAKTIWMERHTTANTVGNTLTLQSGGATASATDKAGGSLLLKSGITTGNGGSQVDIYAVTANQGTGTTDRNPALSLSVLGDGVTQQGGLYTKKYSGSLADDGTITLPTGVCGMLRVWSEADHGTFYIDANGIVTFDSMSANMDDADTDAKLDVYDGGTGAIIKNRLGSEKKIRYIYEYSTE